MVLLLAMCALNRVMWCGRCIDRFDHHCPVIWNCLGAGNIRIFFCFIICMVVAQGLHICLTLVYCQRAARRHPTLAGYAGSSALGLLQAAFVMHPGKTLLALTLVGSALAPLPLH